jgi:regulatory protein
MKLTKSQLDAFQKAAFLCSQSEKCIGDIREKLRQWNVSGEDSQAVVEQLVAEKFIDDERFARAYAKDKFRFNRWGRQKIEFMLRAKHISGEIIEAALEEIDEENYSDELRRILSEKAKSVKGKDQYDKHNKLMRFAMGRGFESGQIYAALKELGL